MTDEAETPRDGESGADGSREGTLSLPRGFASETGARITYYLTSAVVIVYLSRQLGPDRYGQLVLAVSILTVARLFSSAGLAKSAAKHVAAALDGDEGQIRHIVRQSSLFLLGTITVVSLAVFFGAGVVAEALGMPTLEPLLVVGTGYVVFATLYNYARVLLQGFREIASSAVVYASEGVGRLVVAVGLVALGYGIEGALVGYVAGFALATVIGFRAVSRRVGAVSHTAPMADGIRREIVEYSAPLAVTRAAWVLDREVDLLLVGWLLNPAVVGYYAISKRLVHVCAGMAGAVGFSLGPQFDEVTVATSTARARDAYETALVYVLLVYVPAVVGLTILAGPFVTTVFGEEYRGAVPILQVFCAGIVVVAVREVTEDILDYLGRADSRAVFKLVTSVGNVVVSLLLLVWVGVLGAAVGTVLAQTVYAVLCLSVVDAELDLRVRHLSGQLSRVVGITATMAVVVAPLVQYVHGPITMGGVILSGVAVWGVLASVTGFLTDDVVGTLLSSL